MLNAVQFGGITVENPYFHKRDKSNRTLDQLTVRVHVDGDDAKKYRPITMAKNQVSLRVDPGEKLTVVAGGFYPIKDQKPADRLALGKLVAELATKLPIEPDFQALLQRAAMKYAGQSCAASSDSSERELVGAGVKFSANA